MKDYKQTIKDAYYGKGPEEMCYKWKNWLKEKHPELFKEPLPLKKGDWVVVQSKPNTWSSSLCGNSPRSADLSYPFLFKLEKIEDRGDHFAMSGGGYGWTYYPEIMRKATPDEIEKHLIEEAKKRGYASGTLISYENLPSYTNWGPDSISDRKDYEYLPDEDVFVYGGRFIYEGGHWAEILGNVVDDLQSLINKYGTTTIVKTLKEREIIK